MHWRRDQELQVRPGLTYGFGSFTLHSFTGILCVILHFGAHPSAYVQCSFQDLPNSYQLLILVAAAVAILPSVVPGVLPAEQGRAVLLRAVHQLPLLAQVQPVRASRRTKNHMEAPRPVAMNL